MPAHLLPRKACRGIWFYFPYLALSLGGHMTNTIVPSYQWVLHEFARTRRCPFALSWRACGLSREWAPCPLWFTFHNWTKGVCFYLCLCFLCSRLSVCRWVDKFRAKVELGKLSYDFQSRQTNDKVNINLMPSLLLASVG